MKMSKLDEQKTRLLDFFIDYTKILKSNNLALT